MSRALAVSTQEDISFARDELDCCIKLLAITKLVDSNLEVRAIRNLSTK